MVQYFRKNSTVLVDEGDYVAQELWLIHIPHGNIRHVNVLLGTAQGLGQSVHVDRTVRLDQVVGPEDALGEALVLGRVLDPPGVETDLFRGNDGAFLGAHFRFVATDSLNRVGCLE